MAQPGNYISNLEVAEVVVQVLKDIITKVETIEETGLLVGNVKSEATDACFTSDARDWKGNERIRDSITGRFVGTLGSVKEEQRVFVCLFCGKRFSKKYHYRMEDHMNTHTRERPFDCSYCPKTYPNRGSLWEHHQKHLGNGHKCSHCDKLFTSRSDVKLHEETHIKMIRYNCNECDRSYSSIKSLKLHQAKVHMPDIYACQYCSKTFTLMAAARKHMSNVHLSKEQEPYQCSACKKLFCTKADQDDHKCSGPIPSRNYFLPKPNASVQQTNGFTKKSNSKRPKRRRNRYNFGDETETESDETISEASEEEWQEYDYDDQEDIAPNIPIMSPTPQTNQLPPNEVHDWAMDDESLPPILEDMSIKLEVNFEEEDRVLDTAEFYNDLKQEIVSVKPCFVPLTRLSQKEILEHADTRIAKSAPVRRKHSYRRLRYTMNKRINKCSRQCPFCQKTFQGFLRLKDHINIHTNEKPYRCSEEGCGKRFPQREALRQHEKTHTELRDYQCQQCGEAFKTSSYLSKHKAVIHGEKFRLCKYCHKQFADNYKLKVHIISMHMSKRARPYPCIFCDKAYTTISDYRRHFNSVHPEEPFPEQDELKKDIKYELDILNNLEEANNNKMKVTTSSSSTSSKSSYSNNTKVLAGIIKKWQKSKENLSKGKGAYKCPVCETTYSYVKNVKRHLKTQHPKELAMSETQAWCKYCKKSFYNSSTLRRHTRSFHWNMERNNLQKVAKKTAKRLYQPNQSVFSRPSFFKKLKASILKKKMALSRRKRRNVFTCQFCFKTFSTKTGLNSHVTRLHLGGPNDKPYHCLYCKGRFQTTTELKRHKCRGNPDYINHHQMSTEYQSPMWKKFVLQEEVNHNQTASVDRLLSDEDKLFLQMICNVNGDV